MEVNRSAPATAEGQIQIDADPQTVFSVIAAIAEWPSWNPDVKAVKLDKPQDRSRTPSCRRVMATRVGDAGFEPAACRVKAKRTKR